MSEMPKEMKDHYQDEAEKHADFLAEKVFKPAFIIAFIHGVKHGREDLAKELKQQEELHRKKSVLRDELNSEVMENLCDSCRREENNCPMNPPGRTTSCGMFERTGGA